MRVCFKPILSIACVFVFVLVCAAPSNTELIEPTRSLEGAEVTTGRLTVLSEPPGLEIILDGNRVGKTPAFLVEVESGIHKLQVKSSEMDIYIEQ